MTLGEQVTYVERLAQTSANATAVVVNSEATRKYINEGVREFAKRVGGVPRAEYLTISPTFDMRANWGFSLTIVGGANAISATDIIPAQTRDGVAGATIASDIITVVNLAGAATATMTFNASGDDIWKFTLTVPGATSITIAEPSRRDYVDATSLWFGKTGTETATTWVSEIPDSMVETDLPADFLSIEHVEWKGVPLRNASWDLFISPERRSGTPSHYAIKSKKIRLYPSPDAQELFEVWYRGTETDLAVDGTADSTACPLPTQVHMTPVEYAAAKVFEESGEFDKSSVHLRNFLNQAIEYRMRENNANPSMFPVTSDYTPVKVTLVPTS